MDLAKRILMVFLCCIAAFVAPADEPSAFAEKPVAPSIPWKLPSYTLVARDMDLRVALETFAVAEGLSVVMSQSVVGRFSGDFKDVPPGDFLDRIATTHNLMWYYDGAALYICGAGEIATMLVDLKYMKAGEVRAMLAELGVEDRRFPLKTTSNDELVMVPGPPRYVSLVAEMISRADSLREKRTFNEIEARVFPLVHTWADDVSFRASSPESTLQLRGVARILQEIMATTIGVNARDTSITNEISHFEAAQMASYNPIIRPENRLNAVIVRDVVSRMPMYEDLIKKLDVPQRLVEIDITTVELSRKDALDWQLSLSASGSHGHSDMGAGQNAANLFSPAAIAGKGLAGALTHVHSAYALAVSLTALREKGKARSVSRTSLLTVNNLAAEMSDTQSYHAKVVGTEVATLESVSAGTRLQVKPRILPSPSTNIPNQVWLSLRLDDGGFESIAVDSMPMTRQSTLETQMAVFDGQSVMLAGYFRDIKEEGGWGIPWLRDIPWIGWLFGGASWNNETVQRLFIVTPYVIDFGPGDLVRPSAARARDITLEERLDRDRHLDEKVREQRELAIEEEQNVTNDEFDDRIKRERGEIELREDRRQQFREEKMDDWRRDYDWRREAWEAEKAARRELRGRTGK